MNVMQSLPAKSVVGGLSKLFGIKFGKSLNMRI